jgi:hypothetical protein
VPSTVGIVASGQNFPLSLNPVLWLDAADTTTIIESGGSVSQWNDKSGNGYNVTQSNATNQPTTGTATINGLNVLVFDGSNDSMTNTAIPSTSQPYTYVIVAQESSAMTAVKALLNAVGSPFLALFLNGTSPNRTVSVAATAFVTGPIVTPANVNAYFMSGNGASSLLGTSAGLNSVTISGNRAAGVRVGTNAGANGEFFSGSVAEVLYFDKLLTTQERTDLFVYLNAKWGI